LRVRNESSHEINNDNRVRVVNFATFKNVTVRSTVPHCGIHKYTYISPEGKMHNQIDYVSIDRIWHSSMLDVLSFRGTDYDADHYMVVAGGRVRLVVIKQATEKMDMEKFSLRKLNERELKNSFRLQSQTSMQLWRS
jgi:hypothetical protein